MQLSDRIAPKGTLSAKQDILQLLGSVSELKSTDPRDKIFGIGALVEDRDIIHPNYSLSYEEVSFPKPRLLHTGC
jgi:hypothetical protein